MLDECPVRRTETKEDYTICKAFREEAHEQETSLTTERVDFPRNLMAAGKKEHWKSSFLSRHGSRSVASHTKGVSKMAKKKRSAKARGKYRKQAVRPPSWIDDDGLHVLVPGAPPSPGMLEGATRLYQEKIRNSPIWDKIVGEVGKEEAERLLKQFRVEAR